MSDCKCKCKCEHKRLKWCKDCGKVTCSDCGLQFVVETKLNWTLPQIQPIFPSPQPWTNPYPITYGPVIT